MNVTTLYPFSEVFILRSKVFRDARGFFAESYNTNAFKRATGLSPKFVQDNHSRSSKGVLRGIHYQLPPHPQGKLVRVMNGAIWDVAVDLRKSSTTFGKWAGHELRGDQGEMIWIPPGFGHAFLTLEDNTNVFYKTTDYYFIHCEAVVAWNDPHIRIRWPQAFERSAIILSEKDRHAPQIRNAVLFD